MAKTIYIRIGGSASWARNKSDWRIRFFLFGAVHFLQRNLDSGRYKVSLSRKATCPDYTVIWDGKSKESFHYKVNGHQLIFCKRDFRKVFLFPPKKIYVSFERVSSWR